MLDIVDSGLVGLQLVHLQLKNHIAVLLQLRLSAHQHVFVGREPEALAVVRYLVAELHCVVGCVGCVFSQRRRFLLLLVQSWRGLHVVPTND